MNRHCSYGVLRHAWNRRLAVIAIPTMLALACSGIAFCSEIHEAAKTGDLQKVKALFKADPRLVFSKEAEHGETPLHLAVRYGHKDVAEFLLEHKADVNAKNNVGGTPLHVVANSVVAAPLLANKADVNARDDDGDTPLHSAAFSNHKDVAELLLANNAAVDAKNNNGRTPLAEALSESGTDVAELLLAKGADINSKDKDGMTPLIVAAVLGDRKSEVARFLLAHGADVNAKEKLGFTPLHLAVGAGQKDLAALLLANKADVNAKNRLGQTPLDVANIKGYNDIKELLLAHGAKTASAETTDVPKVSGDQDLLQQLSGRTAKPQGPRKADPYDHNQSAISVPTNANATVYIFRTHQMVGAPLKPPISCDGVELAHMQNGRYFRVQLDPGRHHLYSNDQGVSLLAAPGGVYYIEAKVVPFTDKSMSLRALPAEETPSAMHKLKALDDKAIVDHTRVSAGGEIPANP
jgi:ankyrin repeat protein